MPKYIALFLLIVPAPTIAQSPAAAPPAAAAAAKDPLDKVVCKTEDTLGSRLSSRKLCLTVRQWKDREDEAREDAGKSQRTRGD